ncbi:hypothetical protein UI24_24015 [Mycobacteroides franklinii]|nr:hypothetical protein [Mycobacteroides franklinii]
MDDGNDRGSLREARNERHDFREFFRSTDQLEPSECPIDLSQWQGWLTLNLANQQVDYLLISACCGIYEIANQSRTDNRAMPMIWFGPGYTLL